jgi:ABC-2 type transport system ATP-binding protein
MGLVHAPSLLFLDEPSTGLDPHNRANLWEHIAVMRAEHDMTIVLTTHYLDEADAMAERVVVVDHGQIIADDTPDALKARLAGDRVVLTVDDADADAAADLARLVTRLSGARDVAVDGLTVTARVGDGPSVLPRLLHSAAQTGVGVTTVRVDRPTLDDVFLSLTGRSLRESASAEQPATDSTSTKDAA